MGMLGYEKKILRKTGLLQDNRGIYKRYLNEMTHWQSHLQQCHNYIIRYITEQSPKTVCVLGSGWLLDVPVDFFLKRLEMVFFVDIVQPPEIVHKFNKQQSFIFLEQDITGGIVQYLYENRKALKNLSIQQFLNEIENFRYQIPAQVDLVISLNILSQLPALLLDFVRDHTEFKPAELEDFSAVIQQQHLRMLSTEKSLILADTEEQIADMNNQIMQKKSLLYTELPRMNKQEQWIWNFDTHGNYHHGRKTKMLVKAGII